MQQLVENWPWNLALLAVLSAQATVIAFLYRPRLKVFVFSLPFPFTLSALSLGRPVDATNVAGLFALFGFFVAVRLLVIRRKVGIVAAIVASAVGYILISLCLARVIPATEALFWVMAASVLAFAAATMRLMPPRDEPGERTPLPIWVKLPSIMAVILLLIILKQMLRGFMTTFPFLGVITAYEARRSLWTLCRQMPIVITTLVTIMVVTRLLASHVGLGWSLVASWAVFLAFILPVLLRQASEGPGRG